MESSTGGVALLAESATVAGYCVGPDNIVHTNTAGGIDLLIRAGQIHGAGVIDVHPHTVAERAAIQPWDVIVEYGGQSIKDSADLMDALARTNAGDQVKIGLRRNQHAISTTAQF